MITPETNNQFRVATQSLTEISLSLIGQNFEELDPCVSEFDADSKILIDLKRKTFYFLDQECLDQANKIIAYKFKTVCVPVELEEIQNWN